MLTWVMIYIYQYTKPHSIASLQRDFNINSCVSLCVGFVVMSLLIVGMYNINIQEHFVFWNGLTNF